MKKNHNTTRHRMPTLRELTSHLYGKEADLLAKRIEALNANPRRPEEELLLLPDQTPIRVQKDVWMMTDYAAAQHWSAHDAVTMLAAMKLNRHYLQKIDVDDTCTLTLGEARDIADKTEVEAVLLHRVNSVLRELIILVANLLDDQGRLRFKVKKEYLRSEQLWSDYMITLKKHREPTSYFTLRDHLRLYTEAMVTASEPVYEAMRDRLIALRWQHDIELSARITLALRMAHVCNVTFRQYCHDIRKLCGLGLNRLLSFCDMEPMTAHFVEMCRLAGFPVVRSAKGMWYLEGFDADQSPRIGWAWKRFHAALCDEDIQDETALHAIDLNPEAQEYYRATIEQFEQQRREAEEAQKQRDMEEGFRQLSEKYKVTKQ